jgi:phenylacetic acid degradation operon negative regulatory protein
MQARSALFDLYGDHLRHRGGTAPVSALVALLAPVEIAAPAVRTAVSRMVRQGWLAPVGTPTGRGYGLTDRASRRLDEAGARIYRLQPAERWDGRWSVAVVEHSSQRTTRERSQRALEFLGYRPLQVDTWVAPRPAVELQSVVRAEGLTAVEFRGALEGDDLELVDRLYRPGELGAAYHRWLDDARGLVAAAGDDPTDEQAFAARSRLLHEWRKFLFSDPGLPRELLAPDWPGDAAAAYFDAAAARLLPGASRFVDCCLEGKES